ncbi:ammonium transporter [Leptolyngbya iicbica]|uniref:histidine kinase n=2 Tax=Cyanophyceae TaxID=3028117 RepID=A0A4V2E1W8_9CYAN|nr:ammonium transporter [Leptolyngbya sp. LK]RZM75584.1 ammonium transporter [Leptolyngbya sp. LK]
MTPSLIDILWVLISASLVFLMQAGFMCLEAGTTRSKNNINVVIKNISDFGISVLCFWLFGYGLMFGQTHYGWVGTNVWAPEVGQGETWFVVFFLFQAMFCSTAVTIVSGAVAERMRFSSYLAISVLVSGFIYPFFGHWAWNGLNVGESSGWLGQLGFVDFAGSTVVHSIGGWVALAAAIIVGPRIGRFSRKRRRRFLTGYDLPLSLLGTLLLWFGWFGFNGGSVLALNDQVPGIITNTVMAGVAGLVMPILISIFQKQKLRVSAVVNGSLAGLVAITANCHAVTTHNAILIGAIGCLCMLFAEAQLQRYKIDDVVGAIPVHLAAGIWGTLAVALFGDLTVLDTGLSRAAQLGVQLAGIVTASIWAFGITFFLLWLTNRRWPLRVRRRDEHIGLNIAEHGAASDLVDFFTVMRRQERTGDLRLRAPVEPFTPVGQIAARYNRVIGSLEQALARTDAIVESAIEVILTVSRRDLRIQSANPAVRKMFGLAEGQLQGTPLGTLLVVAAPTAAALLNETVAPDPDLASALALAQLVQTASEEGTPYELLGRRRSGGEFPVEVTVAALKSQPEDSYTLIVRDITLRKQAEAAILRAEAKDLEAKRLEKTLAELQEAQLQLVHSEKMSSLGQLVAGVAHEINNPVSFIHGNLTYVDEYVADLLKLIDLYLSDPEIQSSEAIQKQVKAMDIHYLVEDLPKILQSMRGGTERITEIVRSLKDFSHQGGAQRKRVDLHQGLDSTLTILGNKLKARGDRPEIEVVREYGDLPLVECFPGQLNQVFMNLLTNAIDALDERWETQQAHAVPHTSQWLPKIILRTEQVADDRIHLHFTDNGIGIPDHVKRRMMDPFFTTKPVGQGTGLGMAISYQIIVERHHGKLNCLSTPGHGTRFLIDLPLISAAATTT